MDDHVAHGIVSIGSASGTPEVIHAVETADTNVNANGHVYVQGDVFIGTKGVQLRLRKVPRMVVVEAGMKITLPKPPKVYIPEQERYEENALDPDFADELAKANFYKGIASTNVYLSLGTSILSLPDDIEPPEGDSWEEELVELGLDIPSKVTKRSRYVAWLRYYALGDDDFTELAKATAIFSGHVTEEQVRKVEETFRNSSEGNTNT